MNRKRRNIVATALAASVCSSLGTLAVPKRAAANVFPYPSGNHRFHRYVYRGHSWFCAGFATAFAPGFYPSLGYLGFTPPPVYAVPPYPAYAYPAPYYRPAMPYAYGSPAVPSYYGPTVPYYFGMAAPYGPAFAYGRAYYGGYRGGLSYARRLPGRW